MSNAMINIYVRLVRSGARTIEEVPEKYREAVNAIINPPAESNDEDIGDNDGSDEE